MFVYGTLQNPSVYKKVTGAPSVEYKRARVEGFKRVAVAGCDYPAMLRSDPGHSVKGKVVWVQDVRHAAALDEFEGSEYVRETVDAVVLPETGEGACTGTTVKADAYLWAAPHSYLDLDKDWSLEVFEREKLHKWISGDEERAAL